MENAILNFMYGLTLGVTGIIILQFIMDEYYSLKNKKSWPTAESTQDDEEDQHQENDDPKEGSEPTTQQEEESAYNEWQKEIFGSNNEPY